MTSESHMTDRYIEEHEVVERYAMRRLDGPDLDAFEVRLLTDEALRDDVVAAETIFGVLRQHAVQPKWTQTRLPLLAAAASIVLAFGVMLTFIGRDRASNEQGGEQLGQTRVFHLSQTRSGSAPFDTITLRPSDDVIVLTMYPSLDDFRSFRVSVEREDGGWTSIWRGPVAIGNDETIAVALRAPLLAPGQYRLRAEGRRSSGEFERAGDLLFRVDAP